MSCQLYRVASGQSTGTNRTHNRTVQVQTAYTTGQYRVQTAFTTGQYRVQTAFTTGQYRVQSTFTTGQYRYKLQSQQDSTGYKVHSQQDTTGYKVHSQQDSTGYKVHSQQDITGYKLHSQQDSTWYKVHSQQDSTGTNCSHNWTVQGAICPESHEAAICQLQGGHFNSLKATGHPTLFSPSLLPLLPNINLFSQNKIPMAAYCCKDTSFHHSNTSC